MSQEVRRLNEIIILTNRKDASDEIDELDEFIQEAYRKKDELLKKVMIEDQKLFKLKYHDISNS